MLAPKKQKYRKTFRDKIPPLATRGSKVSFGQYGLKALTSGLVSAAQIEAARRAIAHHTKREGQLWIRIFPDKPVTAKSAGRMGSGKGDIKFYAARVPAGKILFEIAGVTKELANEALKLAASKLPVQTKIVEKEV